MALTISQRVARRQQQEASERMSVESGGRNFCASPETRSGARSVTTNGIDIRAKSSEVLSTTKRRLLRSQRLLCYREQFVSLDNQQHNQAEAANSKRKSRCSAACRRRKRILVDPAQASSLFLSRFQKSANLVSTYLFIFTLIILPTLLTLIGRAPSQSELTFTVTAAATSANRSLFNGAGSKQLQLNRTSNKRHASTLLQQKQLVNHPASYGNNNKLTFNNKFINRNKNKQLKLSHHILCEAISQLSDLRLACENENQFIIILEAYYSDLFPEHVCKHASSESKLNKLTGSQLKAIFQQLYSDPSSASAAAANEQQSIIRFNPTLTYGSQRPFCLDDLKQSFQAKCSGRQRCKFSRFTDHQFPACVNLKPGHVFARYLCIDNALLVKYCNADELLASHTSVLNRVKRSNDEVEAQSNLFKRQVYGDDLPTQLDPSEQPAQVDTLDFGFVASPGYPNFYATPKDNSKESNCGWTIEAEVGQKITVKLLDASLAPHEQGERAEDKVDYTTSSSLFPYNEQSGALRQVTITPTQQQQLNNKLLATSNNEILVTTSLSTNSEINQEQQPQLANVHFEALARDELNENLNNKGSSAAAAAVSALVAPTQRIVFKIDQFDYDVLKVNLANKLQQVVGQCQGYDQLIVRDSAASTEDAVPLEGQSGEQVVEGEELELISKLPISLYKNNLIDFNNQTIYHSPSAIATQQQDYTSKSLEARRVDYQALINGLNPLQLVWLYQHNVTLCSTSQQDQLSAPLQKNKISFESTGNTIQVDLVSGHMFNPTNRGVLFWYHKHGCPATTKVPSRVRLLFHNETTEIYACFESFVFSDTRQSLRIRHCSKRHQVWEDVNQGTQDKPSGKGAEEQVAASHTPTPLPPCVYVEELANSISSDHSSSSAANVGAKFDRLIANQAPFTPPTTGRRVTSSSNDVAVEVVGVTTTTTPALTNDLLSDVEFLTGSQPHNGANSRPTSLYATNSSFWKSVLDYMTLNTVGLPETDFSGSRSIMTHEPLKEQRLTASSKDSSFWLRAQALFDRRLLAPAIAVLFLFILINIIIYVIFLVALPKFARLICSSGKKKEEGFYGGRGGTIASDTLTSRNKLSHYESDYSVTMGMSL